MAAFLDPYVVLFHGYSEKNLSKAYCQFSAYLGRELGGKSDVADLLVDGQRGRPVRRESGLEANLMLVDRQAQAVPEFASHSSYRGDGPEFCYLLRLVHNKDGVSEQKVALCDFHFVVNSGTALRPMLSENTSAK